MRLILEVYEVYEVDYDRKKVKKLTYVHWFVKTFNLTKWQSKGVKSVGYSDILLVEIIL